MQEQNEPRSVPEAPLPAATAQRDAAIATDSASMPTAGSDEKSSQNNAHPDDDAYVEAIINAAQAAMEAAQAALDVAERCGDTDAIEAAKQNLAHASANLGRAQGLRGKHGADLAARAQEVMAIAGTVTKAAAAEVEEAAVHEERGVASETLTAAAARPRVVKRAPVADTLDDDTPVIIVTAKRKVKAAADKLQEVYKQEDDLKKKDPTIAHDMHRDFSDHLMGHTADGHAKLTGMKGGIVAFEKAPGVLKGLAIRTINTAANATSAVAHAAADQKMLGMDQHAANTADQLRNQVIKGKDLATIEAGAAETVDAVARHIGGRTFVGQEIDDAMPELQAHYGNKLGNWLNLDTSDVMKKLVQNGWAKDAGFLGFHSYDENRQWSAEAVKALDRDGNGQISAAELEFALDHTKQSYDLQRKIDDAKKQAVALAGQAEDFVDSKTKLGKQLEALLPGLQGLKGLDTDHDGKLELHELVDALKARGIKSLTDANHDGHIDAKDVEMLLNPRKTTVTYDPHAVAPTHAQATPKIATQPDHTKAAVSY